MAANSTSNTVTAVVTVDTSQIRQGMADAKKQIGDATRDIAASSTVTLKQPTLGDDFAKQVAGRMEKMRGQLENDAKRRAIHQATVDGLRSQGVVVPLTRQERARFADDKAFREFMIREKAQEASAEPAGASLASQFASRAGMGRISGGMIQNAALAGSAIFAANTLNKLAINAQNSANNFEKFSDSMNLSFELASQNPMMRQLAGGMAGNQFKRDNYGIVRDIPIVGNLIEAVTGYGAKLDREMIGLQRKAESAANAENKFMEYKVRAETVAGRPLGALKYQQERERLEYQTNMSRFHGEMVNGGTRRERAMYQEMLWGREKLVSTQSDEAFQANRQYQAGLSNTLTKGASTSRAASGMANLRGDAVEAFTQSVLADAQIFENEWRKRLAAEPIGSKAFEELEKQRVVDRQAYATNIRVQARDFAANAPMAQGMSVYRGIQQGEIGAERQRLQGEFTRPFVDAMKTLGFDQMAHYLTIQ